jgi:hypothetical protein
MQKLFNNNSRDGTAHVEFLKPAIGDNAFESGEFNFTAGGVFDPLNPNNNDAYL